MRRHVLLHSVLGSALLGIIAAALGGSASTQGPSADTKMHAALAELGQSLREVEGALVDHPFYESDPVGAYLHLARVLHKSIESEILQDPDFPFFRVMDFTNREGGDNPDQRYLFSPVRGGEEYRVWGTLGSTDRIGYETRRRPRITSDEVARRIASANRILRQSALVWPNFVNRRYVQRIPTNTLADPIDTARFGGVSGRWMVNGHFDLPEGGALVVKTWPTQAQYQGIQLTDLWFASLEYANGMSNLTAEQADPAPDGAYYFVIAAEDPGYANWLDTSGLRQGTVLLRYDGVGGKIPRQSWPSATLVEVDRLREHIPGFDRSVSREERERAIAARRKHVQIRFHR